jgi:exodeoxyribonuclease V beta subunit
MKMGSFEPFLAYEASAGSGKTFNLVVRYLSLLFMGEAQSTILALTFTNKAANEMRIRVVEVLKSLENRVELAEISRVSGLSQQEIMAKRDKVLAGVLKSELKISTIDTFFGAILRKFSLHLGLMPTFVSSTGHHEEKFLKRFLHEVESAGEMGALMKLSLLSDKRLDDIFSLLASLYTKHKELDGLFFSHTLTLNNDAIKEVMVIAKELASVMETKNLSERARKTMEFEGYDELLSKTWLFKESLNYWDFKKTYESKMDTLLFQLQEAVLRQMKQYEVQFLGSLGELLKLYRKSRQALMMQNNELTFDDITLMVHELLRGKLESEFLYFRLDAVMKHLLLDEFQDTSVIQFDILRPLIEEIVAGVGANGGGSFFFVGDVKQSIYRFRGGASELFYQVADHFDVHVRPLDTNYRSCATVVDFVNHIFEPAMPRYVVQKAKKEGGYVEVTVCDEPLDEVKSQVQKLKLLGISENDIAVLCATNADAQKLKEILEMNDVLVVNEASSRLIHQPSVAGVIEYLRYCYYGEKLYAANCCALLTITPDTLQRRTMVDVRAQVLEFIMEHSLGDASVVLFIESLGQFRDIEEFIFEIDRLDVSAPQSTLQGVKLMTVHKSKGLEFEHVIVMDRLGRMKNRSETIIYDYEGIVLQKLYVRTSGREMLDGEYARALEKEKKLSFDDQMNALYVAMTRAVQSLHVVAKANNSWFEPLGLGAGEWGERKFERRIPKKSKLLSAIDYKSLSYGKQSVQKSTDDESQVLDFEAIEYGLALHYGLEMLETFEKHSVDNALECVRKKYGISLGEERLLTIKSSLISVLQDDFFRELTRGTIYKEQSFVHQETMGVIDLLVQHDCGHWVVVDYKSGEDRAEKYTAQVLRYMDAVAKLTQCEVRGYVCLIGLDHCQWRKIER